MEQKAESDVYIRRDPETDDVIVSQNPASWGGVFGLIERLDVPQDFLADRQDSPPQVRPEL